MFKSLQIKLKQASRWLPLALLPFAAHAQAPANDNCTGAIALTAGATCTPVAGTNANATASTGVSAPSCGGTITTGANDVWYSAVVPASGGLTVATSAATGSNVDDTVVELFTGTCGSLTSVACNDDAGGDGFSNVSTTGRTPGSTMYIRVMSYGTSATGAFNICVTLPAAGLANDNPTGAINLTVSATCTPVNGTNVGATTTPVNGYANPSTNAACGIAVNPRDVWYKFTTAASGAGSTAATITVTGAPAGYIRVFSSPGGTSAGPFTEVGCASGGANNTVSAPLTLTTLAPNTTYHVFVAGFGSGDMMGPFTICATAATPALTNDLALEAIYTLGTVSSIASPVGVQAVIRNVGSAATTARTATLTVSGATTFTSTQAVPAIAPGAVATITFPGFPVSATTGTNTVVVTLTADDVATNNSQTVAQTVSMSNLSYAFGTTYTGGAGIAAAGGIIAVGYRTAGPAVISTVTPNFFGAGAAGTNYDVVIYSASATGQPGAVLYTLPAPRPRPVGAAGVNTLDAISIPNVPVNGAFFIGIRTIGANNLGITYQTENPLRGGVFFFTTTNGTTWTDINTSTLNSRILVDVTLRMASATRNEALAATVGLSPNPAHASFKLTVPAGSLHVASASLINALGQVVQQRQLNLPAAGGTAEFNVSGLATGVYSLQLKTGNDLVVKRVVVE